MIGSSCCVTMLHRAVYLPSTVLLHTRTLSLAIFTGDSWRRITVAVECGVCVCVSSTGCVREGLHAFNMKPLPPSSHLLTPCRVQ